MSTFPPDDKIRVAVVTGRHPFDVPGFHAVFRSLSDVDAYVQHLEDFASDAGKIRDLYDVVVLYHMFTDTPPSGDRVRKALEQLGSNRQGILVLHHAILAYPQWALWDDLVGVQDRAFGYHNGQNVRVEIADVDHPITRGLSAWDMVDETYTMCDPGEGSHVILTVRHPRSMGVIAWTRSFREARVFCLQSGHDNETYVNPNFRAVVLRGIRWCAGRI